MYLDEVPLEILDLIASYILLIEAPRKDCSTGLCLYTPDADEHHLTDGYTTASPCPVKSTVASLASVSRHFRDVFFTSRQSRFVKVRYDGKDFFKATEISSTLIDSVK